MNPSARNGAKLFSYNTKVDHTHLPFGGIRANLRDPIAYHHIGGIRSMDTSEI
jgi:hypothetical protein